jgi:dinuclear metal center YbgI/SA1388 family protein
MRITDITQLLEQWAPRSLQESYDNSGLITGDPQLVCTGVLCALDATEEVIDEAVEKGCNLVVAHHPILFGGVKKIDPNHYVGRALIKAIRNDVSLYAIHTNLDNVIEGVSKGMADQLGLQHRSVLSPQKQILKKLYTFVPSVHVDAVSTALFQAGAGHVGRYDQCSFRQAGEGSFRASEGANPFVGEIGVLHREPEWKLEVIFPAYLEKEVLMALKQAHPYEEVAYDLVDLSNEHPGVGAGLIGELPEAIGTQEFLNRVKQLFGTPVLRFSGPADRPIKKVALCGGAGSFLISKALASGADVFLTADLKYHEFFEADGRLLLVDLGHYESEQFTIDLIQSFLAGKFPNFAVLKTGRTTNPVCYH